MDRHQISILLEQLQAYSPKETQETPQTQPLARVLTEACSEPHFATMLHQATSDTLGLGDTERARSGETAAAPLSESLRGDRLQRLEQAVALSELQRVAMSAALQSVPSVRSKRSDQGVLDWASSGAVFGEFESCALIAASAPEVMAAIASANDVHTASARVSAVVRADVALSSLARSERARQFGAPPLLLTRASPPGGYDSDDSDVACGAAAVSALVELGPAASGDVATLGRVVRGMNLAGLMDSDAALLVALIAGALDSRDAVSLDVGCDVDALTLRSMLNDVEMPLHLRTWRLDVVVEVMGPSAGAWSATRVAYALDSDRVRIASPQAAAVVLTTFCTLLGRPFPTGVLRRAWCHRERVQLPLTAAAVLLLAQGSPTVSADPAAGPLGGLVVSLVSLGHFGHAVASGTALDGVAAAAPQAAVAALCSIHEPSRLKERVLAALGHGACDAWTAAAHEVPDNTYVYKCSECCAAAATAAALWRGGRGDVLAAALAALAVSVPNAGLLLMPNARAALDARALAHAAGISTAAIFSQNVRLGLCLAALDAEAAESADAGAEALSALLRSMRADKIIEPHLTKACLDFVAVDALGGAWRGATVAAIASAAITIAPTSAETPCLATPTSTPHRPGANHPFGAADEVVFVRTLGSALSGGSHSVDGRLLGGSTSDDCGIVRLDPSRLLAEGGRGASDEVSTLGGEDDVVETVAVLRVDDVHLGVGSGTASEAPNVLCPDAAGDSELPRASALPTSGMTSVQTAGDRPLSIAELMPAASEMQPAVAPSEIVLDCVHMVFNNVSHSNLEAKVKDIAPLLHEEHFGWFANYLVVKRISTQPNFHTLYLAFLEKLGADEPKQKLLKCVISAVFHNIAKLLRSSKITTSTSERSLLKNLGSWLGQITLARNRPILQRQLDVKELLYQGYESGRLIAICPFVAKILEGAKASVVFRPPNPWLMGLMAVLRDLYDVEDLKMNIKFEIEVLSKHLGIKLDEITGPVTLSSRAPPTKDRSPDFNVKRAPADTGSGPVTNGDAVFPQGLGGVAHTRAALLPQPPPQQPRPSAQASTFGLTRSDSQGTRIFAPGQGAGDTSQPQSQPQSQPGFAEQTVIPNLASYITVSPQLASGPSGAALRRVAPVAVDRAIREIIQPVVERSVTIACITTKELVAKDFATEPDDGRVRKAAALMVSNLAGSLALVTCKEPLRVSIAKHLRALLQQQPGGHLSGSEQHDQHVVQTCAAENLDLGCMLIEKAATEKAIRDVDEAMAPTLKNRQKRFDAGHGYADMGGAYGSSASSGRYPAALPEPLRPKASGLLAHQFYVYEAFQRPPRQTHVQQPSHALHSGGPMPPNPHAHQQHQLPPQGPLVGAAGTHAVTVASQPHALQQHSTSTARSQARSGARGGAAALSRAAQQAASERPSISIAELMDAYRSATAKLDGEFAQLTTKMPGTASHDLSFHALRSHPVAAHVGDLLLAAARVERASRDDAALAIAQSTFKAMCEPRALEPPVRLETLAIVLAAVADISAHLVRDEVANWIAFLPAHTDADRFLHAHVLVRLLGVELLDVAEVDAYLARNMDGGRSAPWLDIALGFVELSVAQYRLATFPGDLQRIARVLEIVARQPHPPPALRRLVAALSAEQQRAHAQTASVRTGRDTGPTPSPVHHGMPSMAASATPVRGDGLDLRTLAPASRPLAASMSATAAARELRRASIAPEDPPGARDQVTALLEQWIRVWNESPGSEKAYAQYLALLQQHAVPRSDASTERFIRLATTICVESCVESRTIDGGLEVDGEAAGVLNYAVVDAYAKLLILLVKYAASDPNGSAAHAGAPVRLDLLNRVLSSLTRCLVADYDATAERGVFDQRPYFRLLLNLLQDLNVPDPVLDSSNVRVLAAFATVFHALQPAVAPGFAFSWLELVSHRMFMPNLLLAKNQRGWILMHRLLIDLFVFLEPYLRDVCLSDAVRLLYKGALRVLLVLLHDFPEFLSDYHFSFCDVIPSSCIQLRNLFLSAFPRSMRLPDPFTPNLKVDLLPEISVPPRILSNCVIALEACGLREPLDEYLQTRHPISFLLDLPRKLQTGIDVRVARDGVHATYNVPLVNALVVHVGTTAIAQLHAKSGSAQQPITHSTPMDVFQHLMNNLDSEGRYFLLNAIANQLRYPNNHTHYFSCVLLYLFAEATSEYVQEQVTRVLLERLIVHRPHPWGLLITFIELIKNPRYSFWSHGFTHCATEIERVFESVARSCMGPGHLSNTMDPAADN